MIRSVSQTFCPPPSTPSLPRPFVPLLPPLPRCLCRHQPEAALQLLTAAQEPSDDTAVAAGGPASAALHPSAVLLARARAALLHGRMGDTAGAMSELVKHKMRVASAFAAAGADGGGGSGGGAGSATPAHVQLMTQARAGVGAFGAGRKEISGSCTSSQRPAAC